MDFKLKLHSFLVLVFCGLLASCSEQGSGSPEQAIERYTKAYVRADRKELERFWWVSENQKARDAVIGNILAMNTYNKSLRKNVPDALEVLIQRGQVADFSPPEVPTGKVIRNAVETSFHQDDNSADRFSVFLPGWPMLSVARHQDRWYVEHSFGRIGRAWEENEIAYMSDVNQLYLDAAEEIGQSEIAKSDIGLVLELRQVYFRQQELMRKHDVDLVVYGFN